MRMRKQELRKWFGIECYIVRLFLEFRQTNQSNKQSKEKYIIRYEIVVD